DALLIPPATRRAMLPPAVRAINPSRRLSRSAVDPSDRTHRYLVLAPEPQSGSQDGGRPGVERRVMQRRLAAILSADVVGYSGLMEVVEAGTLERLKANRSRIFDPFVAAQGGRVVKLMGDGALVEFGSVVAAVN